MSPRVSDSGRNHFESPYKSLAIATLVISHHLSLGLGRVDLARSVNLIRQFSSRTPA